MLQWYLIEELLLNDNVPLLIVLCFWHNISETVSLSPDVCSDSFVLAGIVWFSSSVMIAVIMKAERSRFRDRKGDPRLCCAAGMMLSTWQPCFRQGPEVQQLCSGSFEAVPIPVAFAYWMDVC